MVSFFIISFFIFNKIKWNETKLSTGVFSLKFASFFWTRSLSLPLSISPFFSHSTPFSILFKPVLPFIPNKITTWEFMAAPPARARADYDYLIKLLLIGDSGKLFYVFFFKLICRQNKCCKSKHNKGKMRFLCNHNLWFFH